MKSLINYQQDLITERGEIIKAMEQLKEEYDQKNTRVTEINGALRLLGVMYADEERMKVATAPQEAVDATAEQTSTEPTSAEAVDGE